MNTKLIAWRLYDILIMPLKLAWNLFVFAIAVALVVAWLCFVIPSVIGIILLLIFWPTGFIWPIALCALCVPIWPERDDGRPDWFVGSPYFRAFRGMLD